MKDLAVCDPQKQTAVDSYRMSTDAAAMCKEIVLASAQNIQGKKYVRVEGWQAIAIAHGCTASSSNVERTDTGFRAIGKVIRMSDGMVLSTAEGFVGDDEATWGKRPEYARRAMAQTRAISRACRSAFAHVVVMMNAGLSTTPAEEVPDEGFKEHEQPKPAPKPEVCGDQIITGIEQVTMKRGEKNGKPWVLYTIHAGEKYTTFSETLAKEAKRAAENGLQVKITYEQTEKGRNLKTLEVLEPREPGEN